MAEKALVLLGDQLFPISNLRPAETKLVFMAEDLGLCMHFRYHKAKIVFFLASMRHYKESLEKAGYSVTYRSARDKEFSKNYFQKLEKFLKINKVSTIVTYPIVDRPFATEFQEFIVAKGYTVEYLASPFFITPPEERHKYFSGKKRPFMKTFYEAQRRRTGYLMTKRGTPEGGKYSFDVDNRKRLPKDLKIDSPKIAKVDAITQQVMAEVEELFAEHPGEVSEFWLPVNRKGAEKWLAQFFNERFADFGPFEDAITTSSDFVYHSALSPLMNAGILTPQEVVEGAIQFARDNPRSIKIESLEGFVRQIIGWREFVYGIDLYFGEKQEQENFFKHKAKLKACWYSGETGIPPLDDAIQKAVRLGYNHHIERLMIIGNLMLLCRVHPQEVHRWFMEMYVDSADWVMGPNVFGMSQFSDGGIFATKPYICGSNYFLKMSHYRKGHWCDVLDGLYWSFIDDHRDFFAKQPRLNMMSRSLDRMDKDRKRLIFEAAINFREKVTKG